MKKLSDLEGSFGRGWMGNALIGSLINVEGGATGKSFFLRFFRVEGSRRGGGAVFPGAVDYVTFVRMDRSDGRWDISED